MVDFLRPDVGIVFLDRAGIIFHNCPMKHLITNWQDTENPVSIGDPDDFILPEDDDGGEGRQRDADFRAEVRRMQKALKNALKNPLAQRQAD